MAVLRTGEGSTFKVKLLLENIAGILRHSEHALTAQLNTGNGTAPYIAPPPSQMNLLIVQIHREQ